MLRGRRGRALVRDVDERRLRILIATSIPWPGLGGLETHLGLLATELALRGHSVALVARRPPGPEQEVSGAVRVHRLLGAPLDAPQHLLRTQAGFLSRLLLHLIRARGQYDVLYLAPMSRVASAAAWVAGGLGKRVVGRVVVASASETGAHQSVVFAKLRRRFHAVVAQTPEIADQLISGGIRGDRVTTIPNPVDTRRFRPLSTDDRRALRRARWPQWPDDALVVLTASRLVADKGTETLLHAVAGAPSWRVVVAGDGPERQRLERLAASIGLGERFCFAGRVADMAPLYQACDAFALLPAHEVLSNALLEALSSALPAIVTKVGGLTELGAALGIPMVAPSDADAVRSALEDLGRSPARRAALGAAGRRLAESRFATDVVIPQYVGVLARGPVRAES